VEFIACSTKIVSNVRRADWLLKRNQILKNNNKLKMKKNFTFVLSLVAVVAMIISCNKQPNKQDERQKAQQSASLDFPQNGMRIVYIDVDSLTREYDLSKDRAVLLEKASQEVEDAAMEAQKVKDNIEYKYSKNMYTSQAQFEQDQARLQRLAADYEKKLRAAQELQAEYQQTFMDSVTNYLKVYQEEKQFDLILNSSVLMQLNPKYDVTHDVAVGLNNRYKKSEVKAEEKK